MRFFRSEVFQGESRLQAVRMDLKATNPKIETNILLGFLFLGRVHVEMGEGPFFYLFLLVLSSTYSDRIRENKIENRRHGEEKISLMGQFMQALRAVILPNIKKHF